MKNKMQSLIAAFLTAYAFTAEIAEAPIASMYAEKYDYFTACVYSLLDGGKIVFVFILALAFLAYSKIETSKLKGAAGLSVLFTVFSILGPVYDKFDTFFVLFSPVNAVKTILCFMGFFFFYNWIIPFLYARLAALSGRDDEKRPKSFLDTHTFFKSFLIIFGVYFAVDLLSYPGNLCYDSVGQMEMVLKISPYSCHHPIVHTLLMGGLTRFGGEVLNSYAAGIFMYVVLQSAMLSVSLAATVAYLKTRRLRPGLLWTMIIIYTITPVYSNIASTAIKDVPFMSFVVGYMLCLAILLFDHEISTRKFFTPVFIVTELGMMLFRNNGIYIALAGAVAYVIYTWRGTDLKDRVLNILKHFIIAFVLYELIILSLETVLDPVPGRKGEIFSLPFQVTARYAQLYEGDYSDSERAAIDGVITDIHKAAGRYNPRLSDGVKMYYNDDAGLKELTKYAGTWVVQYAKHPLVCTDGILNHVFGWFSPGVSSAIRYEGEAEFYEMSETNAFMDKVMLFVYRFADKITPLGALQNMGLATWALFFILLSSTRQKKTSLRILLVPLWVSLLIACASPGFYDHPRYGFPILFTLPLIYGLFVTSKDSEN